MADESGGFEGGTILIRAKDGARVYKLKCSTEAEALVWYLKIQKTIHAADKDWQLTNFDPKRVVPCGPHRWLDRDTSWLDWSEGSSSVSHGTEAVNVLRDDDTYWQASGTGEQYLTFDFGKPVELSQFRMKLGDGLGCPRHNLQPPTADVPPPFPPPGLVGFVRSRSATKAPRAPSAGVVGPPAPSGAR